MEKLKLYAWICRVNLYISAFTFGGGYVVVPMIRKFYVDEKAYFSKDDLMEMAAIAQSSPGAIAINLGVLAGKKSWWLCWCAFKRNLWDYSTNCDFSGHF
ncbi:chromate transporter [Enterococcus dispar]|uniref:chromate transporter n=1 Tax=Enterococcus dispar TaxID=44009 RepID=UPI001E4DBA05|nr:chromate transporter [Enterococcus dispar]